MNAFKISWMLFKNNLNLYRFYLAVLILVTAISYDFLAVSFNPYLQVLNEQYVYAQTASILGSVVLFMTVLLFMFHANNFFYKLRYKEIGTYILMGIPGNKIGAVFAMESILLGATAVITGLPLGMLFSKLFFMMLGKAMILDTSIPFYIPPKAIIVLLVTLTLIVLFMGLKNYRMVRRSRLIDILNASRKEQKRPGKSWFRGILGMVFIAVAYYLVLNILNLPSGWPMSFLQTALFSLILICVGTYLFFGSFLGIILDMLIRRKNIIYKKSRLVSFSNTLFRLETNYRSLSMTAVLCAATLTALSGSLSLKYYADTNTAIEAPYSIMFFNQNEATNQKIMTLIRDSSHQLLAEHESRFLIGTISSTGINGGRNRECLVTSLSGVEESLKITRPKSYQKILDTIRMSDNETVCILHSGLILSNRNDVGQEFVIQDRLYNLKDIVRIPFVGGLEGLGRYDTYIITDEQYNRLKNNNREMTLYGVNISEPGASLSLVQKIAAIMKNPGDNLNSFAAQYQYKYYLIGAFYFVGFVMAIVFIILTFSTMYFKILSDAIQDRAQYRILMKIGMMKQEVKQSINAQVGIAFVLPVLLGLLHGVMAIKALESFIHYNFALSIMAGAGVLIIVMTFFYIFISNRYSNMVINGVNHETV